MVNCECIPQDGKPDRKVYHITAEGRTFLLKALENPTPCHKVRSEFLATMCFAHLMPPEQVAAIIEHRREELERYLVMFADFEANDMAGWTPGMQFVCGFGKAVTNAIRDYLDEHGDMLTTDHGASQRASAG